MDTRARVTIDIPVEIYDFWAGQGDHWELGFNAAIVDCLRRHHLLTLHQVKRGAGPTSPSAANGEASLAPTWKRRWNDLTLPNTATRDAGAADTGSAELDN